MTDQKHGYEYTLGNNNASIIFMNLIMPLPFCQRSYTLKCINRYVEICKSLQNNKHKNMLYDLIFIKTVNDASKYLDQRQKTYLENVLKTKLRGFK